jgi:ribonuclease VapC
LIAVDSSAVIAILHREPGCEILADALTRANRRIIGAPTLLEIRQVMGGRHGRAGIEQSDALLEQIGAETVSWTAEMADLATSAFLRFGKGQGHPAQLNFGDCMAYAVARAMDVPLLYVGDDFAQTDIRSALTE